MDKKFTARVKSEVDQWDVLLEIASRLDIDSLGNALYKITKNEDTQLTRIQATLIQEILSNRRIEPHTSYVCEASRYGDKAPLVQPAFDQLVDMCIVHKDDVGLLSVPETPTAKEFIREATFTIIDLAKIILEARSKQKDSD